MLRSGSPQAISLHGQGTVAVHLDENAVPDEELIPASANHTSPRSSSEGLSIPTRSVEVEGVIPVGIPTIAVTPAATEQRPASRRTSFSHLVRDDGRLPPVLTSSTSSSSSSPSSYSSYSSPSVASPASPDNHATASFWSRWSFGAKTTTKTMPLTGDSRPGRDPESRKARAGAWWPGTPESSSPSARSSRLLSASTTTTVADAGDVPSISRLRKSHTVGPSPGETPSRPGSSAFSFITSSMSALSRLTQQNAVYAPDDELCNMNIEAALQPSGPTSPDAQDVSPAAMKEMQAQATALLTKFQTAYRAQSAALRDMQAELSAERDERAGADARNRQLRSRLDNMVAKASEHEQSMAAILEELTAEKKARIEYEQAAKEKGIALVAGVEHEDSVVTEDLGAEEDQMRRRWAEERTDGGSETSDEEGYEEASIFSRSRSPTIAPSIAESPDASPTAGRGSPPTISISGRMHSQQVAKPRAVQQQPQQPQRWNALQKMFKGGAADATGTGGSATGCLRCRGADASVAWNTVSLLRDENKGLKQQVAVLETAVEGALDVVNGVGL